MVLRDLKGLCDCPNTEYLLILLAPLCVCYLLCSDLNLAWRPVAVNAASVLVHNVGW